MNIQAIDSNSAIMSGVSSLSSAFETHEPKGKGSFSEMLIDQIKETDLAQKSADDMTQRALLGNAGVDLHDAQIASAKAELDMRLLIQVRNKALEVYRDVMSMSV
ncbi:MAG: flagellar hook-basal body complex protein FliE [Magnetococcales bacterium]|nr:flagellar hook-basal body complex protein FliE [Magnetococcales bacterium]MBF0323334.1 flagellar hook-basal body complex protein FliE [Magnetococcales bacterium]